MTHLADQIRILFAGKRKIGKLQDIIASNKSTENKIRSIKKVHVSKNLENRSIAFAKRQENEEYIRGFGFINKEKSKIKKHIDRLEAIERREKHAR